MRLWKRWALGALTGAASVVYARAVVARNRALERPPIRNLEGEPFPIDMLELSDGEVVEYIDVGEGPPVIWVPGADGPKETFLYQLPHFAGRYRVIAADMRATIDPDHDFDRLVDDVMELADHAGVERFAIVGQSLGSAVVLRLATRFPDRVTAMVLANPVAKISYDHVGLNRSALVPIAQTTTRYLPTEVSRALARAAWGPLGVWIYDDSPGSEALIDYALYTGPRTTSPSVSRDRVDLLRGLDLTEGLWDVRVPTLVVKGPHDVYCPVSWALEIADSLPDATYVPITGTGHCSHISRPGAFNQVVESWLEKLLPGTDAPALQPEPTDDAVDPDGGNE